MEQGFCQVWNLEKESATLSDRQQHCLYYHYCIFQPDCTYLYSFIKPAKVYVIQQFGEILVHIYYRKVEINKTWEPGWCHALLMVAVGGGKC